MVIESKRPATTVLRNQREREKKKEILFVPFFWLTSAI